MNKNKASFALSNKIQPPVFSDAFWHLKKTAKVWIWWIIQKLKRHVSKLFTSQTLIWSSWWLQEMRKMFSQQPQPPLPSEALLTLLEAILYSALQFRWLCWYDFLPVHMTGTRILIVWTNCSFLIWEKMTCLKYSSTLWFQQLKCATV